MNDLQPLLKIESPCPMTLGRIQNGSDFYCNSCSRTIIDFRDKSGEEIIRYFSAGTGCGIFHDTQVQKVEFSLPYKFVFRILTFLAILGFNVKPLAAQQNQTASTPVPNVQRPKTNLDKNGNIISKPAERIAPAKEKRKWWQKKRRRVVMGYIPYR